MSLLLGSFENEEFGNYTRYTYYKPEATSVVTCGKKRWFSAVQTPLKHKPFTTN